MRYTILLGLFAAFSLSAFAQTRTVTNADLEKFRQKRLAAEREYRENYARLGFPSPEELNRRNEESARRLTELSEQLRAERLEAERAEAARRQAEAAQTRNFYYVAPNTAQPNYAPNYIYGYPAFGYYYRYNRNRRYYPQVYPQYDNPSRFWSFTRPTPPPQPPPPIIRPKRW